MDAIGKKKGNKNHEKLKGSFHSQENKWFSRTRMFYEALMLKTQISGKWKELQAK